MDIFDILCRQVKFAKKDENLSKHTTMGIGGSCRLLVEPFSCDEIYKTIDFCNKNDVLYTKVGNCSNLIVADDGFDGVVIKIGKNFADVFIDGNRVVAQAGAFGKKVYNVAMQNGLGGVEFLATLPATVGGAVVCNAGCFGGCMQNVVSKVWATDGQDVVVFDQKDICFGYRDSVFKHNNMVVTQVEFCLYPSDKNKIQNHYRQLISQKKQSQPLEQKSAGCFFKKYNGVSAGYYIDKLGLKGFGVGDVKISQKHAGFFVNNGGATLKQVIQLMSIVKTKCKNTFGISLEPEVVFLGSTDDFRRLSYTYGF